MISVAGRKSNKQRICSSATNAIIVEKPRIIRPKPFKYPLCAKEYKEELSRTRHIKTHTQERTEQCEHYCDFKTLTRTRLRLHQERMHKEITEIVDVSKFYNSWLFFIL